MPIDLIQEDSLRITAVLCHFNYQEEFRLAELGSHIFNIEEHLF